MFKNKICPRCDGNGTIMKLWCGENFTGGTFEEIICPRCNGVGEIEVYFQSKIEQIIAKLYAENNKSASEACEKIIVSAKTKSLAEEDDKPHAGNQSRYSKSTRKKNASPRAYC